MSIIRDLCVVVADVVFAFATAERQIHDKEEAAAQARVGERRSASIWTTTRAPGRALFNAAMRLGGRYSPRDDNGNSEVGWHLHTPANEMV